VWFRGGLDNEVKFETCQGLLGVGEVFKMDVLFKVGVFYLATVLDMVDLGFGT
jgi:hypothetical protein